MADSTRLDFEYRERVSRPPAEPRRHVRAPDRAPSLALALLLLTACQAPATQLVVRVGSELDVPGELSSLEVSVTAGPGAPTALRGFELARPDAVPLSFGVVPGDGGPGAALGLRFVGRDAAGREVVRQVVDTGFVEGETRLLSVVLRRACAAGCPVETVDPRSLPTAEPGAELAGFAPPRPDLDGGPGDGGPGDAGRADATPDVGVADAGVPPGDAGIDAGADPDGGPDAGSEDAGCEPLVGLLGPPVVVAGLRAPHPVDRPVLLADLDGDGRDELVVASAAQGRLSVLDLEPCPSRPTVASFSGPVGRGPVLSMVSGSPTLLLAAADRLEVLRYRPDPPRLEQVAATVPMPGVVRVSGDREGSRLVIETAGSAGPGLSEVAGNASTTIPAPAGLLGAVAFARADNGIAWYVGVDGDHPHLLTAGRPAQGMFDGADVVPIGGASVLPNPTRLGLGFDIATYVARRPETGVHELRLTSFRPADGASFRHNGQALDGEPIGPPVLGRLGSGAGLVGGRAWVLSRTGSLIRCDLVADRTGAASCQLSPSDPGLRLPPDEVSPSVQLVTADLDGDADPDPIFVGAGVGLLYAVASDLSQSIARLELAAPASATPAVSIHGLGGLPAGGVLVVPHADGALSVVAWQPGGQLDPTTLWSELAGGPTRSGGL